MLVEAIRTFTQEDLEDGVRPHLGPVKAAVYLHGDDDVEWSLDVRGLMLLPEEQGKGYCIHGDVVDLDFDPVFIYSKLDIFGPDDQSVATIDETFEWLQDRIDMMNEPAVIVVRNNWTIRYMVRDQRRIASELKVLVTAAKDVLSCLELDKDRIVPPSETEDDDDDFD